MELADKYKTDWYYFSRLFNVVVFEVSKIAKMCIEKKIYFNFNEIIKTTYSCRFSKIGTIFNKRKIPVTRNTNKVIKLLQHYNEVMLKILPTETRPKNIML